MKSGVIIALAASVLATAVGASAPRVLLQDAAPAVASPVEASALSTRFRTVVAEAVGGASSGSGSLGPEGAAVQALQEAIIQAGAGPEVVIAALDLAMAAENCAVDKTERTYLVDDEQRRYFVDLRGRRVYRDADGTHYVLDAAGVRTDVVVEDRWNSAECAAMARVLASVRASIAAEEATGAIGDAGSGALPVGALAPPPAAGGSDYAAI